MFNMSFDGYHVTVEQDLSGLWQSIVDTPGGAQVREWRQSFDDAYDRAMELISGEPERGRAARGQRGRAMTRVEQIGR